MLFKDQVKDMLDNFDNTSTDEFLKVIEHIKDKLTTNLTQQYLAEKIDSLKNMQSEDEQRKLRGKLKPYLDWYVQGT